MIRIMRPAQPALSIYTRKSSQLDKNQVKDAALRTKLLTMLNNIPAYKDIRKRLKNNEKFTKAEAETLKAIAYFADQANFKNDEKLTDVQPPKFDVYRNDKLKDKLRSLFFNKCAYCESDFAHVTPPDIEHFRPKAAINPFTDQVDSELIYPGYYWLGANWENLLWSCPLCNRKTKQKIPESVEPTLVGKKNRFPVKKGKRIRSHNESISDEEPHRLLLNPCAEDPQLHLEFQLDGLVMAKLDKKGKPSTMGEASIPAYALNRADLKRHREKAAMELSNDLLGLISALELFIGATDPAKKQIYIKRFNRLKKGIQLKFAPEAQYLAQKEVVIKDFFAQTPLEGLGLTIESLLDRDP